MVGDEVYTHITGGRDMWRAVLVLFATYYVFDISYPKQNAGVLLLLQRFTMGQAVQGPVSQSFRLLEKALERMDKGTGQ